MALDMEWFYTWWNNLGLIGQIMACAAIPMTVVMILQLILMLIGIGFESDADGDVDGDVDVDVDTGDGGIDIGDGGIDIDDGGIDIDDGGIDIGDGSIDADDVGIDAHAETSPHDANYFGKAGILKIFTVRGIVAFFALGGWAGLAALSAGLHPLWAIQISLFVGVCALLLAAIVIRLALRMQTSGNIDINNAISHTAEVYIRIPPSRTEKGKVTMLLQERFVELDAVTDSDVELMPNTKVDVVALADENCLVVSPVPEETE